MRTFLFLRGPQDWLTNRARDWAARCYADHYRRIAPGHFVDVAIWRVPVRQKAFLAYLDRALAEAGLPLHNGMT